MKFRRELFTILAVCVLAGPVSASDVHYWIEDAGDLTWNLWTQEVANPETEDIFGLAQYAVEVLGADTISNVSPFGGFSQAANGPVGFNFARSADGATVVSASQDVTSSTFFPVTGFGVEAGSLPGPIFGNMSQVDYGVPLLLATGSYTQEALPSLGQLDGLVCMDAECSNFGRPTGGFSDMAPDGTELVAPVVADSAVEYTSMAPETVVMETLGLTADPAADAGTWALDSFASPNSQAATVDPNTGLFSWVGNGSPEGVYDAVISYTDNAGADTGTLSITWHVPEPATMSLFGLAMVGLMGLVRRRK